ncbi:MAG: LacI family DNA-binding transcriptional regulator [Neobacillus sp.]|jgi:LacI family transcriptional regulator, repressor for deo operon, udp, cdd, tsx, nupC, and nupG
MDRKGGGGIAKISDVARMAGLSPATVSRVLNGHPYVSEEKKNRVKEAVEKLNYFRNSSAQKLRSQKTDTIAVCVPLLTNPFFAYLLEGIDRTATEAGLQLLVCQTRYEMKKELQYLNLLKTKQVDGIILTSIENDWNAIEEYTKHGPIILCNEQSRIANVSNVHLDQVYGGYIGTRHLIERGYEKIAYCRGEQASGIAEDREAGYNLALAEFGLSTRHDWIFRNATDIESGKQIANKIATLKNRPNAVFTGGDQVAAGIVLEAKRLGIKVPEELAVIGFDDQPIAEVTVPPLTTIRQPIQEIGRMAMDLLIDQLKENTGKGVSTIKLPLKLIIRAST